MDQLTSPTPAPTSPPSSPAHGRGFWVLATVFTLLMSFTTVPTALYPLYQARDEFPTFVITLVFAAYGVGVMLGLYLAGHLSDHRGRRVVILSTIVLEVVSAAIFVTSTALVPLLVARLLCGLGIGALTSSATAHLGELAAAHRPDRSSRFASTVATVANTGGLALGPVIGGALAVVVPDPLTTPYLLYLVVLALCGAVMLRVPETVEVPPTRPRYRPQQVRIDDRARPVFRSAAIAAGAAFSVLGFFTALTGTFVGGTLQHHSPLLIGAVASAVIGASALSQIALAPVGARTRLIVGMAAMVIGLGSVAWAAHALSLTLFVVAGVLAGAGVGLVFQSAIAVAVRVSSGSNRSGTVAGMFLAAYTGITVPVIAVGVLLTVTSAPVVLEWFAILVALVVAGATTRLLRTDAG